MRVRVAIALGFTAVSTLVLPACSTSTSSTQPSPSSSAYSSSPAASQQRETPLTSAELTTRLLDPSDLGSGFTRKPEGPARHDDVAVLGCPALNEMGGDAGTGGSLTFPRRAKATFTYGGSSDSELSEELYSDTVAILSDGTSRIFNAMTGCPKYQILSGDTPIDVSTQKTTVPQLGDEQWSQLLTFSFGGRNSVVKQTAIRKGGLLLVVSGSPALVGRHVANALAKATAAGWH
ncbi:hypothetical protein [Streptomyces diastatochromogenes]|uniref:PknH-like extracellular domain-containing protein n=1 Tax=Streptomyces diastatochromogenes TaxID=42236 RepID=A0A233SD28_STRDA|nr:hypothetical protein [Streptomyces diastatochromogenes]MCZ0990381.1 hypothetical protein [Streptomyces diastatochromogenes]OXY93439.1 hypothetical protein BEK98_22260 [Streptomyces diastatochromogenes]